MCLVLIFTSNKSTGLFYAVSLLSKRIIRRVIAHTAPCHQHTSRHVVTPTAPRHRTRHVNTHTAPCHHTHCATSSQTPRHVITHPAPCHHTHCATSSQTPHPGYPNTALHEELPRAGRQWHALWEWRVQALGL